MHSFALDGEKGRMTEKSESQIKVVE